MFRPVTEYILTRNYISLAWHCFPVLWGRKAWIRYEEYVYRGDFFLSSRLAAISIKTCMRKPLCVSKCVSGF